MQKWGATRSTMPQNTGHSRGIVRITFTIARSASRLDHDCAHYGRVDVKCISLTQRNVIRNLGDAERDIICLGMQLHGMFLKTFSSTLS